MKKNLILLAALGLGLALTAAAQEDRDTTYKFQEKDEIRNVLKFHDPTTPGTLIVDNVFGAIDVRGTERADVEMVARRTIRAKSQERIGRAKAEVKLDIKAEGGEIDIYVDGPFRCQTQDCEGLRWRDWGYEVQYDFVLKVPRRTALTLKTVNRGDIAVRGVEGDFDVRNVNGKIVMESVAGSVRAHTVNGGVRVGFTRNPAANCAFKTINGDVEISFREGLAADFRLQTMHGEAYSDFASTKLPAEAAKRKTVGGKTIFKRGGYTGIRIGKGGPEIRCDTLNGDILIKRNG